MSPTKMTVFDELMRNITLKDHIDSLKGEIEDVKKNALFKKEQDYRLMETLRKDLIRFSSTQFQHNKRLRERVLNCQPSCLKKTDNAQSIKSDAKKNSISCKDVRLQDKSMKMNRISEFSPTSTLSSPQTIDGSIEIQSTKLVEMLADKKTNATSVVPKPVEATLLSKDTAGGEISCRDVRLKERNSKINRIIENHKAIKNQDLKAVFPFSCSEDWDKELVACGDAQSILLPDLEDWDKELAGCCVPRILLPDPEDWEKEIACSGIQKILLD